MIKINPVEILNLISEDGYADLTGIISEDQVEIINEKIKFAIDPINNKTILRYYNFIIFIFDKVRILTLKVTLTLIKKLKIIILVFIDLLLIVINHHKEYVDSGHLSEFNYFLTEAAEFLKVFGVHISCYYYN